MDGTYRRTAVKSVWRRRNVEERGVDGGNLATMRILFEG